MSDKISKFVVSKFNVKKASKGLEPGTHRIYVNFLIGRDGKITKINSRAPNATLEKEVTRIIKKLPKMKAGRQKGQAVGVLYTLPITFKIDKDKNKKG
jgi:protein TonB